MAVDGRSLAPLLRGSGGPVGWRQAMGITHERMGSAPGVPSWRGVRTTRYAYWKFQGGGTEVYDMSMDREQKRNIAVADPALTRKLAALSDRLAACSGSGVPPPRGPRRRVAVPAMVVRLPVSP